MPEPKLLPAALSPGYHAVDLAPRPADARHPAPALRVCAVVRQQADNPQAGHLVVLRDTVEARVFLGCLADAGGRAHRWVEIWVQAPEALAGTPRAYRQVLNNAALDERW